MFIQNVLEALTVWGARIGLKISINMTKSLRLGMSAGKMVMMGNEKVDSMYSFIYLGIIINKDDGCSENVKSRIAKPQDIFSQFKKA